VATYGTQSGDPDYPQLQAVQDDVEPHLTFGWVTDRIAIGSDLGFNHDDMKPRLDELVRMGITMIVDARIEWDDEDYVLEHAPGIEYVHLPANDNGGSQNPEWYRRGTQTINEHLKDVPNGKVYIHCHMGVNRGPSMAFATLLTQGFDPVWAIERIREVRPIAYVWYAKDALRWYQKAVSTQDLDIKKAIYRGFNAWWKVNGDNGVAEAIRRIRASEGSMVI
jgi:dual specificity phosphatase 3